MDNLGEVFHESKVCSHLISETSKLTQLRNQSNFITSLSVLVDDQRLVDVTHILIVSGLVVLHVADLLTIFLKSSFWRHSELNSGNFISLLVVPIELKQT